MKLFLDTTYHVYWLETHDTLLYASSDGLDLMEVWKREQLPL
jgi:hypothetical protein